MSLELDQAADREGRLATSGKAGELTTGDKDGPLFGDVAGLRASWQQIQAEFVDDPREAVADAAALVEHTTQALVGSLRQRQQRLRAMWDDAHSAGAEDGKGTTGVGDRGDADQPAAGGVTDTEQLRLLLQRYRVLFNQICRP
jgi:hypothetical protein